MDSKAAEFAAKLMLTFKVEAEEHLKGISDCLLTLEKGIEGTDNQEIIETLFREAHSLKGAARAVNLLAIQDSCQALENVLANLKNKKLILSTPFFTPLYKTVDLIEKVIHASSEEKVQSYQADLASMIQQLDSLKVENPFNESPEVLSEVFPLSQAFNQPLPLTSPPLLEVMEKIEAKGIVQKSGIVPKTIRVSIDKLDRLIHEVEELLIIKLITGQRAESLVTLGQNVKQAQKGWIRLEKESQALSKLEGNPNVSEELLQFIKQQPLFLQELHEELQKMMTTAKQDFRLVGSLIDSLLDNTKKVLMQPFSSLFEILPRMVRDIACSLDKKVNLILQGGDIEVDRRILDELKDPLIHLMRNCIDHGIESSQERNQQQKAEMSEIVIAANQISGNSVELVIRDDGRGIDADKVKQISIEKGMITEKEASNLTQEETLRLIFKSGVSTSPIVTELSGRGVGLNVVMEKVEKLSGQIAITTTLGKGTSFKILLPLTISTFRGVHLQAAGQDFIFPTHNLHRVLRINPQEVHFIEGKETIYLNQRHISYTLLSEILQLAPAHSASQSKFIYILVIKAADTLMAIGVDKILNEQEVFVKGLGKQLNRIKNISAATVMEWGKVIPILNPFDLVKHIKQTVNKKTDQLPLNQEKGKKKILIAEDSATSRILLKNILDAAGFSVMTAVDGQEAFILLKTENFDLLLSDVEMPRLTGFQLTQKIRAHPKLKELPIVLCTSRGSKEDREQGIDAGANAYIDKSSFLQSQLLDIIQRLI